MLRAAPTLLRSSLSSARRLMSRRPIVGGNWKCNPASASKLPELIANINACDTAKCADSPLAEARVPDWSTHCAPRTIAFTPLARTHARARSNALSLSPSLSP